MFEVAHAHVVATRFNQFIGVEIVAEENAYAFAPRISTSHVQDSTAMRTCLRQYVVFSMCE